MRSSALKIVELGRWQHVDRLAVEPRCLDVGVARAQGVACRQLEVLHTVVVLARGFEARLELGGDLPGLGAIGLLLTRCDPALPFDSPRLRDAAAEALLIHGMHEGVAVGHGAVGPVLAAARGDELLALGEAIADLLDGADLQPEARGDGGGGELRAAHGGDL